MSARDQVMANKPVKIRTSRAKAVVTMSPEERAWNKCDKESSASEFLWSLRLQDLKCLLKYHGLDTKPEIKTRSDAVMALHGIYGKTLEEVGEQVEEDTSDEEAAVATAIAEEEEDEEDDEESEKDA
jgi:hypothetical protein